MSAKSFVTTLPIDPGNTTRIGSAVTPLYAQVLGKYIGAETVLALNNQGMKSQPNKSRNDVTYKYLQTLRQFGIVLPTWSDIEQQYLDEFPKIFLRLIDLGLI